MRTTGRSPRLAGLLVLALLLAACGESSAPSAPTASGFREALLPRPTSTAVVPDPVAAPTRGAVPMTVVPTEDIQHALTALATKAPLPGAPAQSPTPYPAELAPRAPTVDPSKIPPAIPWVSNRLFEPGALGALLLSPEQAIVNEVQLEPVPVAIADPGSAYWTGRLSDERRREWRSFGPMARDERVYAHRGADSLSEIAIRTIAICFDDADAASSALRFMAERYADNARADDFPLARLSGLAHDDGLYGPGPYAQGAFDEGMTLSLRSANATPVLPAEISRDDAYFYLWRAGNVVLVVYARSSVAVGATEAVILDPEALQTLLRTAMAQAQPH